jgi:penicillin-binding protein 1A
MALLVIIAAIVVLAAMVFCLDVGGVIPRYPGKTQWWTKTFIGRHTVWRLVVIGAAVCVALPFVVVAVLVAAVMSSSQSGPLPTARPPTGSGVTTLYDVNGAPIATFQQFATYIPVTSGDIPEVMKNAAVASEDRRFYSHKGVDTKGILRALWVDLNGGSVKQGGSTIDQQYVRLVYGSNQKTLARKLREAILAGRLDALFTKDQILTGYLNRAYFGGGAYGVAAAAQLYFHTSVQDLTLSESATLAGILPAPSEYDPRVDPTGAESRRVDVLTKMRSQGLITAAQETAAISQHLVVEQSNDPPTASATVVYPLPTGQTAYPWFVDYVRRYLIARYGVDKVLQGGLKVQTSLDPHLQALANASVANALKGTPNQIGMAMVVIDPQTGLVQAMVGGRDYAASQVNAALGHCATPPAIGAQLPICIDGGGSGRQPGSSFKPFTLAKAFEEGISPDAMFSGPSSYTYPPKVCQGPNCTVRNVESGGFGRITLRQATADSVNTVFAQLIQKVGVPQTAEMAHRLGVTMINANGRGPSGPYGPSLTLGSADVSPLDMASAYGVFAARGMQFPATPVVKVIAPDGSVLEDNSARAGKRVLDPSVADQVNDVLKGVVTGGTGTAANIGRPDGTAGKTGTTQSFSDAWFIGYTPQLVASVWMGNTTGRQPLVNIKGLPAVYGGTIPAETWHDFMSQALAGVPVENFVPPNAPIATCTPASTTTSTIVPGAASTSTSSTSSSTTTTSSSTTTTTVPSYETLPSSELATTTTSTSTTLPPCPTTTLSPFLFVPGTSTSTSTSTSTTSTTLFPLPGIPTTTLFPPPTPQGVRVPTSSTTVHHP